MAGYVWSWLFAVIGGHVLRLERHGAPWFQPTGNEPDKGLRRASVRWLEGLLDEELCIPTLA